MRPKHARRLFIVGLGLSALPAILIVLMPDKFSMYFYDRKHMAFKEKNMFKPAIDANCITSLADYIERDKDGLFVIPFDEQLRILPANVTFCLFQRYVTTLQRNCHKRDHHGTLANGWMLCTDGCYKPASNSVFIYLSVRDDFSSIHGIDTVYNSTVYRFCPTNRSNKKSEILFTLTSKNKIPDSRRVWTFENIEYILRQTKQPDHFLMIDTERITNEVLFGILQSNVLKYIKQMSIRIFFEKEITPVDYTRILSHLRHFYNDGFRSFWFSNDLSCESKHNRKISNCIVIYMVFKECRTETLNINEQPLVIPQSNSIVEKMNLKEIEEFLCRRYLTSIQTPCKEIIRIGGLKDGGWEICHDIKYRPNNPCLVYSFGINWDFRFDDDIADTYGCEVHAFDPSMASGNFKHKDKVWFHNIGVWNKPNFYHQERKWNMSTISNIKMDLNHTSMNIDILKIDIEWDEWTVVPDIISSGVLNDVTQLLIEFHSPTTLERLKILRELYNVGFRIFWYHRNTYCRRNLVYLEYSSCIEVSLVNNKLK